MSSQDNMSEEHLPEAAEPHGTGLSVKDDPFADPGLPPHEPRRTDVDERAARRAERQVALLFVVSMLATVAFLVSYAVIDNSKTIYVWPFGHVLQMNFVLGLTLGVALFCIGAGAVHWARTLMSDEEHPSERHPIEADPDVRAKVLADFKQGAEESGFGRRKLIRNTMFGALGLLPLSALWLFRDLGPLPTTKLEHTAWSKGKLLVNMNTDQPLKASDIQTGSLTFAKPQGVEESDEDFQEVMAKAALMIVRIAPEDIKSRQSAEWGYEGVLAYSKICTHVGCPISLYEQQTHHVLCPCHQSTFDLSDAGKVIFGPAGHPLPQLRISVNSQGYLEALGDFTKPVGPGYWERSA